MDGEGRENITHDVDQVLECDESSGGSQGREV
jgi:hypothetical protein